MTELDLVRVLVPVANRLGEIKATQEIILKTLAHFVAAQTHQPWEPLYDEMRAQAEAAATAYRHQFVDELSLLLKGPPKT